MFTCKGILFGCFFVFTDWCVHDDAGLALLCATCIILELHGNVLQCSHVKAFLGVSLSSLLYYI